MHGRIPYEVTAAGETLRVAPEGIRLSLGRAWFLSPGTALIAALGAGADVTYVEPRSAQPGISTYPAFAITDFMMRPSATIERRFTVLRLAATAGLDVDIAGSAYVVETQPPATRPIWTPWRTRPFVSFVAGFFL